jgi:hypothetical protein
MKTMRFSFAALVAGALFLSSYGDAAARPFRPAQVPNGANLSCGTCHVTPGGPRNAFGLTVESDFLTAAGFAGQVIWGPELAALDSDGDGATNGEELGDPDGTWAIGDADPAVDFTHPADPDSRPPEPEPTAVEATGWGQIKNSLVD